MPNLNLMMLFSIDARMSEVPVKVAWFMPARIPPR